MKALDHILTMHHKLGTLYGDMARMLNQAGFTTDTGSAWTERHVATYEQERLGLSREPLVKTTEITPEIAKKLEAAGLSEWWRSLVETEELRK